MDISSYLASALNQDDDTRTSAVAELRRLQLNNSSDFMLALAREMSNEKRVATTCQLSGILLKNCLVDREECNDETLAEIKEMAVRTLNSPRRQVSHIAAQVTAQIAGIQPKEVWLELFKELQWNLRTYSSPSLKQATLETLGYVCEVISPSDLDELESGDIMRAITNCMELRATRTTPEVRLTAFRAFHTAEAFVKFKFEDATSGWQQRILLDFLFPKDFFPESDFFFESEPDFPDLELEIEIEIRAKAYESLIVMASYSGFDPYYFTFLMNETNGDLRGREEPLCLLAMEFWISIYNEQITRSKFGERGRSTLIGLANFPFARDLLEILYEHVDDCEWDVDSGEWDVDLWTTPKAAQEFLSLLVSLTFDEQEGTSKVLKEIIVPFVVQMTRNSSWSFDGDYTSDMAATLAIGAVIDSFEPFNPPKHQCFFDSGLYMNLLFINDFCDNQRIEKVTSGYLKRVPKDDRLSLVK